MGRQFSQPGFQSRNRGDSSRPAARAQHFRDAVRKTRVVANEQNFQWFKFHGAIQSTAGGAPDQFAALGKDTGLARRCKWVASERPDTVQFVSFLGASASRRRMDQPVILQPAGGTPALPDSTFQAHRLKVSCLSETSCQVFSSKLTAAR